jgi:hypothetical protein
MTHLAYWVSMPARRDTLRRNEPRERSLGAARSSHALGTQRASLGVQRREASFATHPTLPLRYIRRTHCFPRVAGAPQIDSSLRATGSPW